MTVSNRLHLLAFASLGLAGSVLILYATAWGPVIFSDSVGYLAVARNMLAGKGVGVYEASGGFSLMVIHPPFYPLVLAFFGMAGIDAVVATRWLQALFFGLLVFLFGLGLLRLASSRLLALAGALAFLLSPLLLYLFTLAMTEPLFIFLSVLAALGLLRALKQERQAWLVVAAVCVALALMTRYVGMAWVAAGALWVLLFWPGGWQRRLVSLAWYGCVSVLPFVLWQGWLMFFADAPARTRTGVPLGQSLAEFRLAVVDIFWAWLPFSAQLPQVHYRIKLLVLLLLAGVGIGFVLAAAWRLAKRTAGGGWCAMQQEPFLRASALLWFALLSYLGVAAAGYAFSDPTPDLNERTLAMAVPIGMALAFVACAAVYRAWPAHAWKHGFPLLFAAVVIASGMPQSLQLLGDYHREGYGYLGQRWRLSATRLAAAELPADVPLISNEYSALGFWLGRPVYPIHEVVALQPQALDARFGDDGSDDAQQVFRRQGAALVLFDNIRWQLDALYFEQTPERLDAMIRDLDVYGDYADGAIYFYPTP
ncbi:MAG: phospholipid carrier-dependent glycosyltransferase [Chloroflexota bacterium]